MCGFVGIFGGSPQLAGEGSVRAMAAAITHRGPDADGFWTDGEDRIALGHRRLSIIELTDAGSQPMHSADGRWVIAFNGEVYNFPAIRRGLEARHGGIAWQGSSDTEVLLEAVARDGLRPTLQSLDGMFAFALYDRQEKALHLARDAFGEKPLYYGWQSGGMVFASELKALEALPGFDAALDLEALGAFFKYSYVPGPGSIYRGVAKMPPGHCVTLTRQDIASGTLPTPWCWYDMVGEALAGRAHPFDGSRQAAIAEGERLLEASTGRRMVSDVPLGAFLSGGIDSSLTVAMMQRRSTVPVRTFSIGIAERGFDESPAAAAVAAHLGTDHTELVLRPADVQDAIPRIAAIHDEPFADSSQVPTFLVSRMARRDVTVALSGDGGDELFGGYNRHFTAPRLWARIGALPAPLRRAAGGLLAALPGGLVGGAVSALGPLAPRELAAGRAAEKVQKLARVLQMADEAAFHDRLLATSDDPAAILAGRPDIASLPSRIDPRARGLGMAERAMLLDTANYMVDDVLVKVDRAAMAVSLETRTPFLERDLFRFAWSLPPALRHGGGEGKTILREILYRHVPQELVDRPKAGFAIPTGRWLRSGLRAWAEDELSPGALAASGLLDVATIRRRWQEHLTGRRDHETMLWNVLMFQGWWRERTA